MGLGLHRRHRRACECGGKSALFFLHLFIDLLSTETASKRPSPLVDAITIHWMLLPYTIIVHRHRLTSHPPPPPHRQPQINFYSQKMGDVLNNCLMTVDGTDFRVPQKGMATIGNAFASHKYTGKSALRYELGMSILGGDLVWIQGPYPVRMYTDIKIFNKVLHHFLDPGSKSRPTRGTLDTPTKSSVQRMLELRRRSG
jgi:hypothetical protein